MGSPIQYHLCIAANGSPSEKRSTVVVIRSGRPGLAGPCAAQGRTGERASEMGSYGVCVSAREPDRRDPRPCIPLALTQHPIRLRFTRTYPSPPLLAPPLLFSTTPKRQQQVASNSMPFPAAVIIRVK